MWHRLYSFNVLSPYVIFITRVYFIRIKSLFYIFIFPIISSCSIYSLVKEKETSFTINTSPSKANIIYNDKTIGVSPFSISRSKLANITNNDYIMLTIKKDNYHPIKLLAHKTGVTLFKIKLEKYNMSYFKNEFLKEFQNEVNIMTRQVLETQGQLLVKNFKKVKTLLDILIKDYPYLAPLYTMYGVLYFQQKKISKAKSYLLRAIALDPKDSSAKILLGKLDTYIEIYNK